MSSFVNLPTVLKKSYRFAPARDRGLLTSLWKVWTEKSEVYATTRVSGGAFHLSVHESGLIQLRGQGKDRQQLAPAASLGNGDWFHAFELRFLVGERAFVPPPQDLGKEKAYAIPIFDGDMLVTNLLISRHGLPGDAPLPADISDKATLLWTAKLRDERRVALIARFGPMNEPNHAIVTQWRSTIAPKTILRDTPKTPPYVELLHYSWSMDGGNIICVIPMGAESYRVLPAAVQEEPPRKFIVVQPSASTDVAAPNGAIFATVSIMGATTEISLISHQDSDCTIGRIHLRVHRDVLLPGTSFTTPTFSIPALLTIDGMHANAWVYQGRCTYADGVVSLEIRQLSASIRSRGTGQSTALDDAEEIIVAAPKGSQSIHVRSDALAAETSLCGSFLLRRC